MAVVYLTHSCHLILQVRLSILLLDFVLDVIDPFWYLFGGKALDLVDLKLNV